MLPVKVYRVTPKAILPRRASEGAVGFDLFACEEYQFYPGQMHLVRTGLIMKVEFPYAAIIVPRSSLYLKKGLIMPNSVGVIDFDYCGTGDEIKVPLLNLSDELRYVREGERIAQLIFVAVAFPQIVEVDKVPEVNSRGGFGSTGGYKEG